jgi:hypothetical protein
VVTSLLKGGFFTWMPVDASRIVVSVFRGLHGVGMTIHDVTFKAYPRPDGVVVSRWSYAITLVKVIRIPCFGCRMTIGRASIVWPGAS